MKLRMHYSAWTIGYSWCIRNLYWESTVIGDTKIRMERQSEGSNIKQNRESVGTHTRGVLLEGYRRNEGFVTK
jgi:hypothetical protein